MAADGEYGNCMGPNSQYIAMVSEDGHEFFLKREVAFRAETVKDMLAGPGQFPDNERSDINFKDLKSLILRKVCSFLIYKSKYDGASTEIPELEIEPELACELIMAANFLHC